MDFYDCEPVLQPDYESPNEDITDQEKLTHQRRTASAVILFRKCLTPSVKKIITESSTNYSRAMFAKLIKAKVFISIICMEQNLCHQGPEDKLTDCLGKMVANYAQLKDLGAEVRDRDKRVALTTQMNASFRELVKHHTTRSPNIEYHQWCADLLMGEWNNQALNLYKFN